MPETANGSLTADELVETAVSWLQRRLPDTWEASPTARRELAGATEGAGDAAVDVRGPNGTYTTVVLETKNRFGPRDVDRLLGNLGRVLRKLAGQIPVL